jgi:uncharacterized protein YcnI
MIRRTTVATLVLLSALLAVAGPASAHVTVQPGEAVQGNYTKLTFRVPNESDTAATVKLEVELPASIDGARTKPVPGWTATVDGRTIRWEGGRVEPGQFQEFDISVGPLPEVDQLVFKAVQTYSDGSEARWIEETVDGEEEPERPAPVLSLTAARDDEAQLAAAVDQDDVDGARTLGVTGIVVGAVALLTGIGTAVSARRRS